MMPDDRDIKILTIEDDEGLRQSIACYMQDSGFTVYEAGNIQEGLAIFRQQQPDIVFTDLCMPNGNGLELLPVLRDESPNTPVVVISGTGKLNDAVEAMKLGAWDYIDKPVRELSLLEVLARKLFKQSLDIREQRSSLICFGQGHDVYKNYDELTGLPNRTLLAESFRRMSGLENKLSLILLDLDNFKMMNATLGQQGANELLKELAKRLRSVLDAEDMAARIGKDEFVILSTAGIEDVEPLIASLKGIFLQPFTADGAELFVSACMGVVGWPCDGESIDELLDHADMATYEAKVRGNNSVQYFNPAFGSHVRSRIELDTCLRRALEREELILHYQPQIDISTGSVVGVEALLRWQRGEGIVVPPAEFIPALEKSGFIIPVGEWILKHACDQYVKWREQGMAPITLSVNISAPQFKSGKLPATVVRILDDTGMDPASLCLELTESIVMDDIEETIRTLTTLRGLGISLSIDDFGTGYSSLNYLSTMPISELKIDRSFIATIPDDLNNAVIVNTIISMAHCMNIRVVAEGVETVEQLNHLTSRQCQMVQGFYFSKPLRADEVLRHVTAYGKTLSSTP